MHRLAIESIAMKTLMNQLKTKFGSACKDKPTRPKPLPAGWYNIVWSGHYVVMNHRPVWSDKASDIMEARLHSLLIEKIRENDRLPSIDELKNGLRTEAMEAKIAKLFTESAGREMHDVDFEIGIQHAFNFISEPRNYDVPGLNGRIKKGLETSGGIIQKYYSFD